MVPFSFRLLFAELPQHNGRPNLALDRLYSLQKIISTIRENLSKGFQEDGSKNDIYNEEEIKGIALAFCHLLCITVCFMVLAPTFPAPPRMIVRLMGD